MESGVYVARFRTPLDENAGVIIINNDVIKGGDSAFYYTGSILTRTQSQITARMDVIRHTEPNFPVFGDLDRFTLSLVGKQVRQIYKFEGRAERVSGLKFEATLERLPV